MGEPAQVSMEILEIEIDTEVLALRTIVTEVDEAT